MNKILRYVILGIAAIFAFVMVKSFVYSAISMIVGFAVVAGLGYVGYRAFIAKS
jgi:hypothetical protein